MLVIFVQKWHWRDLRVTGGWQLRCIFSRLCSRVSCVTLPTIACPPWATETCWTVRFSPTPLRYRLSASICITNVLVSEGTFNAVELGNSHIGKLLREFHGRRVDLPDLSDEHCLELVPGFAFFDNCQLEIELSEVTVAPGSLA